MKLFGKDIDITKVLPSNWTKDILTSNPGTELVNSKVLFFPTGASVVVVVEPFGYNIQNLIFRLGIQTKVEFWPLIKNGLWLKLEVAIASLFCQTK